MGTGGLASSHSYGVLMTGTSLVSSYVGNIDITGASGASMNDGMLIETGASVQSMTSATISLTTTAGDLIIQNAGYVNSFGTGTVMTDIDRDLTVSSSAASDPTYISVTNGDATLTVGRNVSVTNTSGSGSPVQIGNYGGVAGSASAAITINAGGSVSITERIALRLSVMEILRHPRLFQGISA